jgi:hypothetical protein
VTRIRTESKALRSSRWAVALAGNRRQRPIGNGERALVTDEVIVARCGEQTPEGMNPGRGSGAKQTREAGGGGNRRGREKRRGRSVSSLGCSIHKTLLVDVARRAAEGTPRELFRRGSQDPVTGRVRDSSTLERNEARRG